MLINIWTRWEIELGGDDPLNMSDNDQVRREFVTQASNQYIAWAMYIVTDDAAAFSGLSNFDRSNVEPN